MNEPNWNMLERESERRGLSEVERLRIICAAMLEGKMRAWQSLVESEMNNCRPIILAVPPQQVN